MKNLLLLVLALALGSYAPTYAQLNGLGKSLKNIKLGKKDKKQEATTKQPEQTTPIQQKTTIEISEEDVKKAAELADQFGKLTRTFDFYNRMRNTIEVSWLPSTQLEYLSKAIEAVNIASGQAIKAFYNSNKADIDRYVQWANTIEKSPRSEVDVIGGGFYGGDLTKHWKEGSTGAKALATYQKIDEQTKVFFPHFWAAEFVKDDKGGLKGVIDYVIELAYQEQEKSKPDVIKMLGKADELMRTYKQALPANDPIRTEMAGLEKDLQNAIKDIAGEYLSNLYVNDFHKANVNKIFFSKQPIDPKNAKAGDFTTDFTINDEIYAIAYYDAILIDAKVLSKGQGDNVIFPSFINMVIDGNQTEHLRYYAGDYKEMGKQGYITFALKPSPDKADNASIIEGFAEVISEKSPRTHTIPVAFKSAKGEFNINLSGMDKDKVLAEAEAAAKKADANADAAQAANRGLPKQFQNASLYNFKFQPVSVAQVKQLFAKVADNVGKIEAVVAQNDIAIKQTSWEVKVNALGVPIKRVGPSYWMAYVGKDGKCYHKITTLFQKYTGSGYGPSQLLSSDATEYNCAKKKFAN